MTVFRQVMVKHLPRDATAEEVFLHFNRLYDLSKEDWTFKVGSHFSVWLSGGGGYPVCAIRAGAATVRSQSRG